MGKVTKKEQEAIDKGLWKVYRRRWNTLEKCWNDTLYFYKGFKTEKEARDFIAEHAPGQYFC